MRGMRGLPHNIQEIKQGMTELLHYIRRPIQNGFTPLKDIHRCHIHYSGLNSPSLLPKPL